MKTKAALIGAQGTIKADTKPAIDLHGSAVIDPGDAEYNLSFWLADALNNFMFGVVRMFLKNRT